MSNATRILIALVAGLVLGMAGTRMLPLEASQIADIADPIGNLWLNGLRMTIVPLVVALLITGIAQTAEAARAGRIAGRALAWIVGLMSASAIAGAVLTPLFLPLLPMPEAAGKALKVAIGAAGPVKAVPPFADFLRAIVPTNAIAAAANDAILPLIIFTGVFAFALTRLPAAQRSVLTQVFSALADTMIIIIDWVLKLAPIGVFALAFVVGARSGTAAFGALLHYVTVVSLVGICVGLTAYPIAFIVGRQRGGPFLRALLPVQALAVSTQSSLGCLPLMLKKSEEIGVSEATAGVVLPMCVALLRVTGPAMNLSVVLYVANWFGITLGPAQMGVAIVAAALTSMGAVSLPGQVSFVTSIAPISLAVGVPVEPLALLIAVETVPDIFRTLGNVMADMAVTATVAFQTGGSADPEPDTGRRSAEPGV